MKASASILALSLILAVALSCKLSERIAGDDNSVMVTNLWPDVPPFPGATKADKSLPLPARIFLRTFMKGKASFITFRADKPAQEVKNFYIGESMKAAGWVTNEEHCFQDTEDMKTGGTLCTYYKGPQKNDVLGIMVQDDSSSANIFYFRMNVAQQ